MQPLPQGAWGRRRSCGAEALLHDVVPDAARDEPDARAPPNPSPRRYMRVSLPVSGSARHTGQRRANPAAEKPKRHSQTDSAFSRGAPWFSCRQIIPASTSLQRTETLFYLQRTTSKGMNISQPVLEKARLGFFCE